MAARNASSSAGLSHNISASSKYAISLGSWGSRSLSRWLAARQWEKPRASFGGGPCGKSMIGCGLASSPCLSIDLHVFHERVCALSGTVSARWRCCQDQS